MVGWKGTALALVFSCLFFCIFVALHLPAFALAPQLGLRFLREKP